MFIIKSNVSESAEYQSDLEKAIGFFSDGENYVKFMPNLEGIQKDGQGITRWSILVEVPFVGRWKFPFAVNFSAFDNLVEWYPAEVEKENFLRCVTEISQKSDKIIVVKITHNLELRRKQASDLHILAGMAGEKMISGEMQAEVEKMLRRFLERAKDKLED